MMNLFLYLVYALMFLFVFIMALCGKIFTAVCLGVICIISVMYMTYIRMSGPQDADSMIKDVSKKLRAADHKNLFETSRRELISSLESVLIKEEFFCNNEDEDDSIRKSYTIIRNQIERNIESAENYMYHYDYASMPNMGYIKKLVSENKMLVKKLSELSDLVLQINDSACDADTSFADDMLKSLEEMLL